MMFSGYPGTCDEIVTAECAIASTGQSYKYSGQEVTCDTEGLACENGPSQTCLDYKVRFYCSCKFKVTVLQQGFFGALNSLRGRNV